MTDKLPRLYLFTRTAGANNSGHFIIGGCDIVELATTFETPPYVFGEITLRNKCPEYRDEFSQRYPDTLVMNACSYISPILISLLKEEGLGFDIVSGGEMSIARSATFPSETISSPQVKQVQRFH